MARRRTAAGRGQRGQAAVEVALLLPLVVVLLLAVLQVGLLARDAILVTHAAREAARAAAVDATPTAATERARRIEGLDPDRLTVDQGQRTSEGLVRVTVSYRAPTAVPLVGSLLGDRTLRATATMRVEHEG